MEYVEMCAPNGMQIATHASRSILTTSMTSGLGFIVSKLPLGICKTKLIALGTAVTILDPRSTLRFSHSGNVTLSFPSPWYLKIDDNIISGAKFASWAVVVKIRNPEAMQKEFAFAASKWVIAESLVTYSFAEFDKPTKSTFRVMLLSSGVGRLATRKEVKQNSGKETTGETW